MTGSDRPPHAEPGEVRFLGAAVPAEPPAAATPATIDEDLARLASSPAGLSAAEAAARLAREGPNEVAPPARSAWMRDLLRLFLNPLVLVLLAAAAVSAMLREAINAGIVIVIVCLNVGLNFVQAFRSQRALDALRRRVTATALCMRDGQPTQVPKREVVAGDLVLLRAGDIVPADGRLLSSRDLYVDEAILTGESLPAEKGIEVGSDAVFAGTSVMSGTATVLVTVTGPATEFGRIAAGLTGRSPETEFERGTRRFAMLITRLVTLLVVFVLVVNVALGRNLLESLLFAVALAIGLTPELLPMITSVTLAHGAVRMARRRVLVKHLPAIQNLGSMDVLCSDKTGTLTAGAVVLARHIDPSGNDDSDVLLLGSINSTFETGITSPLDVAIRACAVPVDGYAKVDEIPFDFARRRLSVVADEIAAGRRLLIAKGSPESILSICRSFQLNGTTRPLGIEERRAAEATFADLSADGYRVLGVGMKEVERKERYTREDESELMFAGFLAFLDPPKADVGEAIRELAADGVRVVILTGDNDLVATSICRKIGIPVGTVIVGAELDRTSDEALGALAERTTIFARLTPDQKHRVVRALRGRGHVVGFLGDGVNDAPSLQAADVGISVDTAADVAKEAADVILLERDLRVLHDGIREGRESFGNVTKYVLMEMSSNLGNMLSMAAATLFLPFLPMLPLQVLLNNLLYDASQIALPLDRVDPAFVRKPRQWDIRFIERFMLVFGPVSSLFDLFTFAVLRLVFGAGEMLFQTGWFIESLATQTLVIYVIRTAGNPLRSRPSRALVLATVSCIGVGIALPLTPVAHALGFVRPPLALFGFLAVLAAIYLVLVQAIKSRFYRRFGLMA